MNYRYKRIYVGGIQAIILDWAGTTMDCGCMAPVEAFRKVFENYGVPITIEEARAPMGAHKRDHIRAIANMPRVRTVWEKEHGKVSSELEIERMFESFQPIQMEILPKYAELIPGALGVIRRIKSQGWKIGSTTGYTTEMMELLASFAKEQGYVPDSSVAADQVPKGRPNPSMCLENAVRLGVDGVYTCVKVDDTLPGIDAGLSAGMWTVGLAASGNEVGLSAEDLYEPGLSGLIVYRGQTRVKKEHFDKVRAAKKRMHQTGAHYVIDDISYLPNILEDINRKLKKAQLP